MDTAESIRRWPIGLRSSRCEPGGSRCSRRAAGCLHPGRYQVARIYLPEVSPRTLAGIVIDNNDWRQPHPGLPRP